MKIDKINSLAFLQSETKTQSKANVSKPKSDTIEISNTAKVFDNVDKFMNLGSQDRLKLESMNESEKQEFLKMTSDLLKHGIVGYEELEVKGRREKYFIENEIGDERLKGAKLYKKKNETILSGNVD
jgi:hypothetical protein